MIISIKDTASAIVWRKNVEKINEDYRVAMKDAGDCLVDMQNFAEGTLVDNLVNYGTAIINAAEKTFEAINAIAKTVNDILDKVGQFSEGVVSGIKNLGKMFN